MNLTEHYRLARGVRFAQPEVAGTGASVIRPNAMQPMGGEIVHGYAVPGGGYWGREPIDVGDVAQEAIARRLSGATREPFEARRILSGLGRAGRLDLPMYAAGGDIGPGDAGVVGEAGPEVVRARPGGGARVIPLRVGAVAPGGAGRAAAHAVPRAPAATPAPDLSGAGLPAPAEMPPALGAPGFYGAPPLEHAAADRYRGDLSRLAAMRAPEAQPAHGWRRAVADIAGVGIGLLTRSPGAGFALHDYIEQRPYDAELEQFNRHHATALQDANADERAAADEQREDAGRLRQYDADRAAFETAQFRNEEDARALAAEQAREQEAAQRLDLERADAANALAERERHDRAQEENAGARATRAAGVTPDAAEAAARFREQQESAHNTEFIEGQIAGEPDAASANALLGRYLRSGYAFDPARVQRFIKGRFAADSLGALTGNGHDAGTNPADPFADIR